jgi:hypothetical protein
MNPALLQVEGEDQMLELIAQHMDLKPEQRWRAGEENDIPDEFCAGVFNVERKHDNQAPCTPSNFD